MFFKYFLFWLPMILLAFANAALREMYFIKKFNEFRAHQFSTLTLILFCAVYIWLVHPMLYIQSGKQALLIGFFWMMLTVLFEFTLGRLTNKSWSYLMQDYNLFEGRIWLLFLISILLMPYLFFSLRNR